MSRKKRPDLLIVLALVVGLGLVATALSLAWLNIDRGTIASRDQLFRDAQEAIIERHAID